MSRLTATQVRRRTFIAMAHRARAVCLRNLSNSLADTQVGVVAKQQAWRLLYRADAWQALAEGDVALARSLHRAAIRTAARTLA